jgi:hypothetical protein
VVALAFLQAEKMVELAGDEIRVTARFWTRLPFNRSSTVALYAIADEQGWLVGETLEQALAALKRELAGQGARHVDDGA